MDPLRHLGAELAELGVRGLLRKPRLGVAPDALVLCSNDYLGHAQSPGPQQPAATLGAGASRLISGDHPAHIALERTIADWLQLEDALLFSSGYAANVGVIPALTGEGDVIISDELNHASIIDGCRLSRAEVIICEHVNVSSVERALEQSAHARRRWVVTESYFSMDGDSPDLRALRQACDEHDACLIVDEAHALGVFGTAGRGKCQQQDVRADVVVGTLGKAIGVQGAFVAGSRTLRTWLWNKARSFVFSTGVSPWLAAVTCERIARVSADDSGRDRLHHLASSFRHALADAPIAPSHGPIVPWMVGDAARAMAESDALAKAGLFVQAIRPPTVPDGQARLRITLHAKLTDADLRRAIALLAKHTCWRR